jgi:hypothetical protein
MQLNKYLITKIAAAMIVFSFIFLRPSLFGQTSTDVGFVMILLVIFFVGITRKFEMNIPPDLYFFSSMFIFWGLLLLFGAVGDSNLDFLLKAFTTNFITVSLLCFWVLGNKNVTRSVVNYYLLILSFFGYSSLISLLFFFSGTGVEQLQISELNLGYESPSKLLIPFSVLYHDMHSGTFNILRFQSIFRESGIAQAFFTWAFVIAYYHNCSRWVLMGLIFGLLLTFSTTGIAIASLVIPLAYIAKRGVYGNMYRQVLSIIFYIFVGVIIILLSYYATMNLPYFGVASKLETHDASIHDRVPNLDNITLLGKGFYSTGGGNNSAINLLKGSESIGLLLTLFYIFMFTFMSWFGNSKIEGYKVFVALLPLFITSLIAQPIVDAPLVFILLFVTRQVLSTLTPNITGR